MNAQKSKALNSCEPMDNFQDAYVQCILWTERLELTHDFSSFDYESQELIRLDCHNFIEQHEKEIDGQYAQAGHDFWLTRNRHGAGYWDGDWPEPAATILTEVAHKAGELCIIKGDDGVLELVKG